MQEKRPKDLKKKIQTQNIIIIALAIMIVVMIGISSTAAWYIRTKSDSADIILSSPVNIYITEYEQMKDEHGNNVYGSDGNPIMQHTVTEDILEKYNSRIYPGDNIKLKLGVQIGSADEESSPAYVRVKLTISWIKISTGEQIALSDMSSSNMITYKDNPDENVWKVIDFNKFIEGDDVVPDNWYVLKTTKNGVDSARIAKNMEQIEFLDGYINLNKHEITNAQANCRLTINYVVEAIQVPNVPDPIVEEGKGPWWKFVRGDVD